MSQENVEVGRAFIDAVNRGDFGICAQGPDHGKCWPQRWLPDQIASGAYCAGNPAGANNHVSIA
jgi:hypothetical protein